MRLFPLWRQPSGGTAQLLPVMAVLGGVVAVLLALVCANMAGLLLARASGRQRELAVRVLARRQPLAGRAPARRRNDAARGWPAACSPALVTVWSGNLLCAFIPPLPIPIAIDAGLNLRVLALLVGGEPRGRAAARPAARPAGVARATSSAPLKDGAAWAAAARRGRLRQGLIVGQVATGARAARERRAVPAHARRGRRARSRLHGARQGLVGVVDIGGGRLRPGARPRHVSRLVAALREPARRGGGRGRPASAADLARQQRPHASRSTATRRAPAKR